MRSRVATITKKDTIQPCAQNFGNQKTSIGPGDLYIDD